jgi:ATP-dependent helicase/nuclease subunit B
MTDTLFAPGGARLFTLPPSVSFLDALARTLIDATNAREQPEALAEALVFLPNRRAGRALAMALFEAIGGSLAVPDIRSLGDAEETGNVIGPEALDLPPAVSPARRRGALARLIQGWRKAMREPPLPPSSALAAADELALLLDQAAVTDGLDWTRVTGLSLDTDLAEHWRVSASFLEIVAQHWPDWLAEQGAMDQMARQREAALALAARWQAAPPQHPVIIAGSTGSTPNGRILMRAVLALPKGAVILPGLDPDLEDWPLVAKAPSHPQHALHRAVTELGLAPADVRPLATEDDAPGRGARRRLVNEALAPAEATPSWRSRLTHLAQPDPANILVQRGLEGLTLIEAEDEDEEALAAAILLRQTLETPGATAALVTPEAALGRRVSAILKRWGVDVPASAGEPLHRTPSGSFLLLLMRWALDAADPVLLLAVLKHPLTGMNRDASTLRALVSEIERTALRGPRKDRTLDHLAARLDRLSRDQPPNGRAALIRDLAAIHAISGGALAGNLVDGPVVDGAAAAEACAMIAERIAVSPASPRGARVWAGVAGQQASQFLEQLAVLCVEMGGIDAELWPAFAEAAMMGMTSPPETGEHPRIAIWGPLEARLQRRDRMILASLNEGQWPKPPPADAFLNRKLRQDMNLPDPDERVGLAAHDFAQMANAPEVFLMRAKRTGDQPGVASRWLWRLETLAAGGLEDRDEAARLLRANAAPVLHWARQLRRASAYAPAKPPRPMPPRERRKLQDMSPSRAVRLIRDPYSDYAQRILGLQVLARAGEPIDAAARGTAVHAAVETFEREGGARSLEELIVNELLEAGASPELVELERPLWLRAARFYLRWLEERRPRVQRVEVEQKAFIHLPTAAGNMKLSATADRIELLDDGRIAIIDFKTGAPKTAKQVETGLEPQLSLEAAIAAEAMFGSIGKAETAELIYFRMSTSRSILKKPPGQPLDLDRPIPELAKEALNGLLKLANTFADPAHPYLSRPRVQLMKSAGDYDRLARRGEWAIEEGEE